MIRYVGLDVHKHFIEACVIDRKGKVLARNRVDCLRERILRVRERTAEANRPRGSGGHDQHVGSS